MTYDERLLKADHVNLQDGITYDVDGIPNFVGEDTKIPLTPFNPLEAPDEYEVRLEMRDVGDNQKAIDFWRNAQRREPKAD